MINPPAGEWVDEDQVKMLFKQAGLADWTFEANDGTHLRERMYALMDDIQNVLDANAEAPLVLPVDQYFNVKGIGLVAIGYVQSGKVKVHDEVLLLPANGTGNAKSLQVMDDDVEVATPRPSGCTSQRQGRPFDGKHHHRAPARGRQTCQCFHPACRGAAHRSSVQLTISPFQKRTSQQVM